LENWLDGVGEESNIDSNSSPDTIDILTALAPNAMDSLSGGPALVNEATESGSFDWMTTSFLGDPYPINGMERFFEAPSILSLNLEDPCQNLNASTPVPLLASSTNENRLVAHGVVPDTIWQLIILFLEQLHPSMPVFKRSYLLDNIRSRRNLHDRSFNALVHAISALVIFQILQNSSGRQHSPFKVEQAEDLLAEAVRLHSYTDFGEAPVLEHVLTSIFLFGCQFCRGNHNAARYRLHEAVTLAEIMELDNPQRYVGISEEKKERYLRSFLCLTVIHRYVLLVWHICIHHADWYF
jgi:hypothetical protein